MSLAKSVFITTVTGAMPSNIARQLWECNAAGGAITMTLPSAVLSYGTEICVIKIDTSANSVTVATQSSQVIYSTAGLTATTASLASVGKSVTMTSDGVRWVQTASQ